MKELGSRDRRSRGPAPLDAGANLTVHDLKNLAGRLALLCQNLDAHYEDPLFKATVVEVLEDTVTHLERLARDVRDHEGRVMIKLRVDVNQLLQDALLDTRPDLAVAVRLVERYSPAPTIWGDAFLLRSAFACAIENALEAMSGGGVLSVTTSVARRGRTRRLIADIADTGPGMSDQFRERLFQPFNSTKEKGLGLGLYTIRQVAAIHDARVRILTATNTGTRVRFFFALDGE